MPNPNDAWAQVELYRWQYGGLPPQDGTAKELNTPAGLRAMARAILENPKVPSMLPDMSNVASVLRYAADRIEALDVS